MKRPHLLRVEVAASAFAELLAAVRQAGLCAGWLEMAEAAPPPTLEQAATLGVLRAVAVGESGSVVVKSRRGEPVLDDVLREHFLGCRLVLVRAPAGAVEAPRLLPAGRGSWRLEVSGQTPRMLGTAKLVALLRKPRPWC